jgi:hypothetical protein
MKLKMEYSEGDLMKVFSLLAVSHHNMTFFPKDNLAIYEHTDKGLSDEDLWKSPFELLLRNHPNNKKKYKGKKKLVPDIGHFINGSVILSPKSTDLLGGYLKRFGDLYEFTVEGETWFSYDVTNVLNGIVSIEKSRHDSVGTFVSPAFHVDKLPLASQVFKIPENYLGTIYFSDPEAGSETILTMAEKHGLVIGENPLVWDSSISELMSGKAKGI